MSGILLIVRTIFYKNIDSENIDRLQKCIKGDAKEAVRWFVVHAFFVSAVIQTMEILYERSELITGTMIRDIQRESTVKDLVARRDIDKSFIYF